MFGMSTIGTALMVKEGGLWNQVVPITSYPDLGGDPELIDITTLQDKVRRNTNGVEDLGSFAFGALYTPENYQRLKDLEGEEREYALWFGGTGEGDSYVPTGSDGIFSFSGELKAHVAGNGVNEARNLSFSIAVDSEISFDYAGASSIRLDKSSIQLNAGSTAAITATTVPADATVNWTSLNASVATVSSGTVTAVAAGTTVIIADIDVEGVTKKAECTVTVAGTAG